MVYRTKFDMQIINKLNLNIYLVTPISTRFFMCLVTGCIGVIQMESPVTFAEATHAELLDEPLDFYLES